MWAELVIVADFDDVLRETLALLERDGRVSYRALKRRFDLDDEYVEDLKAELIDAKQVAVDERGTVLVRRRGGESAAPNRPLPTFSETPSSYTPPHLRDKILNARSALEGERKQVTVLFADIKNSLELSNHFDPEEWHALLDRFFSILTEGVHRYEGTINQYTGDGVMALFGAPIAHEDHAQRACYAALWLRDKLCDFSDRLRMERGADFGVRIGMNSGDVVVGKIGDDLRMDYTAQGHTVGVAQRVETLARVGAAYLTETTARLVAGYFDLRPVGRTELRGVPQPVEVFELLGGRSAVSRIEVARARGLTPFIGREEELRTLDAALSRTEEGFGQVVGVVGDAGLGKSRLCLEFVERCRARGLEVHEAHCPPHGRNIPFLPIMEIFRSYFGVQREDGQQTARHKITELALRLDPELKRALPVLFEFMGLRDPDVPETTMDSDVRQRVIFDLIHRVTRARAEAGETVVISIDDLHWIDAGSDLYLAKMIDAVENSRGMMLLNFRPEYVASWTRKSHYQQLSLLPLTSNVVNGFLDSLLGTHESVAEVKARVAEWTGGNPFFAEEVVQMLIDTGVVSADGGQHVLVGELRDIRVPSNVRSVLAARIDRLDSQSKFVLQRAAVIGKSFEPTLLAEVTGIDRDTLASSLDALMRAAFIVETAFYPEVRYAFRHPLSHEVSYASQLEQNRRETHALVAEALEKHSQDELDETAPLLAHHWDAAREPARAIGWHRRAAEWAALRDPPSALRHWHRIRELVEALPEDPETLSLGSLACAQILLAGWRLGGSLDECRAHFEDGAELARRAGDRVMLTMVTGSFGVMTALIGRSDLYRKYAMEATQLADATGIVELQAAMRMYFAHANWFRGDLGEALRIATDAHAMTPDDPEFGVRFTGSSARVAALVVLIVVAALEGRFAESRRHSGELDALYARGDFGDEALWGPIFSRFADIFTGTPVSPERAAHCLAEGERIGTPFSRIASSYGAGIVQFANAELEAACAAFERFLEVERERHWASMMQPSALAYYAEALLERGELDAALERAQQAVASVASTGYRWDPRPWHALARVAIETGDEATAKSALETLNEEVEALGAGAYQPLIHELRGRFARKFAAEWNAEEELRAAEAAFEAVGEGGRMELLLRRA